MAQGAAPRSRVLICGTLISHADRNPKRPSRHQERVPVITEDVALRQDIRPLQIALLNLVPEKIKTETQLLPALGSTPLQIEMTLPRPRAAIYRKARHLISAAWNPLD